MCPDGISIEVWRSFGDVAIVWLTKLFNLIFRLNKMPDEWRRSILVPIFKNKGMCKVVLIIGELPTSLKTNLVLCQGNRLWR
jgi:hypothetical protein